MKRIATSIMAAGALAALPLFGAGGAGPGSQARGDVSPVAAYAYDYPPPATYGGVTPAAIIDRVGEILAAIDSPQQRSKLAQQWLEFSKRIIAKDLEFREQWLALQKQQLSRQEEIEQLRLQVAQLQMKVEQLRAENLRLEQAHSHPSGAGPEKPRRAAPSGPSF